MSDATPLAPAGLIGVDRARIAALRLLVARCATGGDCTADGARSPYARYEAERWCTGCIARHGLSGNPFPEYGSVPGIEEDRPHTDIIDADPLPPLAHTRRALGPAH